MILVPEIVIKQQLDILIKHIYDDLKAREAEFDVVDASDGNVGGAFAVAVTQQSTATLPEITDVTLPDGSTLDGRYWLINTPSKNYAVWYNTGSSTAPDLGDVKLIEVEVLVGDTDVEVAVKTAAALANVRDGGTQNELISIRGKLQVFNVPVPTTATITVTLRELNAERASLLFDIFGDNFFDNMNYFKSMGDIVKDRYESEERKLNIALGYNQNHTTFPIISILLPGEEPDPKVLTPNAQGNQDFYNGQFATRTTDNFQVTYSLLITSDNYNETVMIYHFLKALMRMGYNNFACQGFENLWFSGRDITLDFELAPIDVFHRTIAMTFFYNNTLPALVRKDYATAINITGTNIGS